MAAVFSVNRVAGGSPSRFWFIDPFYGTLLSGGFGYVAGTLFGVLILGIIQTLIAFDGSLSSWWTRIVIGALLFVFCLLQRGFESRRQ